MTFTLRWSASFDAWSRRQTLNDNQWFLYGYSWWPINGMLYASSSMRGPKSHASISWTTGLRYSVARRHF